MTLLTLWSRRLWPYATLVALVAVGMFATALLRGRHEEKALAVAHVASVAAADTVRITLIKYVHDTVAAKRGRTIYRAARDSALTDLKDTAATKRAFAKADNALELDSTAIASSARAINALQVHVHALQTELGISERLRAPRYALRSNAGIELTSGKLYTELTSSVRITERWSALGRVGKLWAPGEPTRRYVLASYAF